MNFFLYSLETMFRVRDPSYSSLNSSTRDWTLYFAMRKMFWAFMDTVYWAPLRDSAPSCCSGNGALLESEQSSFFGGISGYRRPKMVLIVLFL